MSVSDRVHLESGWCDGVVKGGVGLTGVVLVSVRE